MEDKLKYATDREKEAYKYRQTGMSYNKIGEKMRISPSRANQLCKSAERRIRSYEAHCELHKKELETFSQPLDISISKGEGNLIYDLLYERMKYYEKEFKIRHTDGIFQQKTCVLRNNYWNLKSNKFHIPKKDILFAICIGLKLNIEKTVQLLAKGGYSFTYNSEFEQKNSLPSFDRLIHDCICMRIYDIDEINQFLIDNGYKERLGSRTLI